MALQDHALWRLETEVIAKTKEKEKPGTDALPATYSYYEAAGRRAVALRRIRAGESRGEWPLGFLYTYACLVSSESDFYVANEKRLLPCMENDRPLEWADWKILARELLRISASTRINIIHRFTSLPLFNQYLRGRHNYGSLFRDNLTWLTTATVFVAPVLTAMQVGLVMERLQGNAAFQQASYGFAIFASRARRLRGRGKITVAMEWQRLASTTEILQEDCSTLINIKKAT
ncbi:hypothetical protein N657DRAFT_638280 [Parathielavia appendiculata]|uniref:Uncharacterized protein n=1 Tax=Parathielavia appendiculata TaxID=2587402 RepID=A0AAN6TP59_9PEZI|nr:hypothetical protein N657DRAFT_638280 [Parathielavia appendiculata]